MVGGHFVVGRGALSPMVGLVSHLVGHGNPSGDCHHGSLHEIALAAGAGDEMWDVRGPPLDGHPDVGLGRIGYCSLENSRDGVARDGGTSRREWP